MTATVTVHALARIAHRLTPEEATGLAARLGEYASCHPTGSIALRAMTLQRMRNVAWSDTSNGDTVVAIVRDGSVETVMLRRSSQPFNRAAFNVKQLDIL